MDAIDFLPLLKEKMRLLEMDERFLNRPVNEGFSGGEKKRNEIVQMAVLEPKLAVLDETDSGLDIDALKIVAKGVNAMRNPKRAMVLVTHYQRLLDYIVPDFVHVLVNGRIVKSGGPELALELEEKGYSWTEGGIGREALVVEIPSVARVPCRREETLISNAEFRKQHSGPSRKPGRTQSRSHPQNASSGLQKTRKQESDYSNPGSRKISGDF